MKADASAFYRLVRTRTSTREFLQEGVLPEVVERILHAACRAPSAHNRQPWRFVVLEQGPARQAMIEALQQQLERDLRADGVDAETQARRMAVSTKRLSEPVLLIVLCLSMEDMDLYPDGRRQEAERCMAEQSVALAGGHLLLAAHAEGLGACWLCAPLFAPAIVASVLDLPASWEPRAFVALGYPASEADAGERRDPSEITEWR